MKTTCFPLFIRASLVTAIALSAALPATAMIERPHGTKADNTHAMREIKIDGATRSINVARNEVVRIANASGEKFTWQFDTLHHPTIDLSKIAPAGFAQRAIPVYVGMGIDERN